MAERKTHHRILVGIDFSDGSRHALEQARALAARLGAEIVLVHAVVPIDLVAPPGVIRPNAAAAATALEVRRARQKLAGYAASAGAAPAKLRVAAGAPADVIVAAAKRLRADMIVVGTAGRTGLRHLLVGSVAERVVRTSAVPVLTVRAPAPVKRRAAPTRRSRRRSAR